MNTMSRSDLINNSIKFRVLKNKDTLFVNMSSVLKDYTFSCKKEKLDEALNTKAIMSICLFTKFYINNKELKTSAYFTQMNDDGNIFNGILSDGTKIQCHSFEYDFESITPTPQELKKLILKNVEDF